MESNLGDECGLQASLDISIFGYTHSWNHNVCVSTLNCQHACDLNSRFDHDLTSHHFSRLPGAFGSDKLCSRPSEGHSFRHIPLHRTVFRFRSYFQHSFGERYALKAITACELSDFSLLVYFLFLPFFTATNVCHNIRRMEFKLASRCTNATSANASNNCKLLFIVPG